jgi:hypothetical protein
MQSQTSKILTFALLQLNWIMIGIKIGVCWDPKLFTYLRVRTSTDPNPDPADSCISAGA